MPVLVFVEQLTIAPDATYQRLAAGNEVVAVGDEGVEDGVGPALAGLEGGLVRRSASRPRSEVGTLEEDGVAAFSSFSRINYGDAHDDDEGMVKELGTKDAITGVLYGLTAWEQIRTKWFV